MEKANLDIIVLGIRGFPDSFSAKINRYMSITNMLVKAGNKVTVLNRDVGIYEKRVTVKANVINSYNASISSYTLKKMVHSIIAIFEMYQILKWSINTSKQKMVIVYTSSLSTFLFYVILCKLLHIKLVYDFVERRTDISDRKDSVIKRNADRIFENVAIKYSDGLFIVSEYLKQHVHKYFRQKPYYKLPPVCDFGYFDNIEKVSSIPYVLYCGSYSYKTIIDFVVTAYELSQTSNQLALYLVINGGNEEIKKLREETKSFGDVKIFSHLSYFDLVSKYKNAKALLIPLRNTIQDIARFPQKICEYTASNSVIISTNIGDIGYYFEHDKSALLASDYDVGKYAELFNYLCSNNCKTRVISMNGYLVGKENFDEDSHFKEVSEYLKKIVKG